MLFNDPTQFEEFLAPVGGNVLIRPVIGTSFKAEITMQRLEHVGLFTIFANSFSAVKEPQKDFYGLTIPLSTPFSILDSGQSQVYESSSAHMLSPGRKFNLKAKRNCHFLVSNFFVEPISHYSRKILQSDAQNPQQINPDISLFTQTGSTLLRSVAKTWSFLNSKTTVNEITLKELEDDLIACFIMHANKDQQDRYYKFDDPCHLARAEEYIRENLKTPITRDQLSEISGRSIRTLSRAFEKKYGIGPMAFIRQRRLDAAYLDLLRAKPDSASVTKIAFDYGFAHAGKFAIEYRKVFGEPPSASLLR